MSRFVNKAIYSVVREEYKGQSISDAFLYLVKVVIKIKEYPHVSIQELCNDFQDFCGFSIPYHPMTVIVGTLKKQGYLKVGKIGALIPDLERIKEEVSVEDLNREQEALDEIIQLFIKFAHKQDFSRNYTAVEAEKVLDDFVELNGLRLLSTRHDYNIIPDDDNIRLFYMFCSELEKTRPELEEHIGALIVGRILTELFISGQNESAGNSRSNAKVYLDTSVVFALLGIDTVDRTDIYRNLIRDTQNLGMQTKVFYHTYTEMITLIEGSKKWLGNPDYNPADATAATRYFVSQNFNADDVSEYANELEDTLNEFGIQVDRMPYPASQPRGVQTEQYYYEEIVKKYRETNPDFDEAAKQGTLDRDARSLFYIDFLNAGMFAPQMQDISTIFVTCNYSLAAVAKAQTQHFRSAIPNCVSDVYWGTLVWLSNPQKLLTSTKVRVAANACAAFMPSSALVKKLVVTVDELQKKEEITQDEAFFLKSNQIAQRMLMELTKGDDGSFTEKTPMEILQIIKAEAKAQGKKEEREKANSEIGEITDQMTRLQGEYNQIIADAEQEKLGLQWKLARAEQKNAEYELLGLEKKLESVRNTIEEQNEAKSKVEKDFGRYKKALQFCLIVVTILVFVGACKLFCYGKENGVDYLGPLGIIASILLLSVNCFLIVQTGKSIDKKTLIQEFLKKKYAMFCQKYGYDEMSLEEYKRESAMLEQRIQRLKERKAEQLVAV